MLIGILGILGLLAAAFIVTSAVLYFQQERIIFYPHPNDARLVTQYQDRRIEIASDGATLEGWWAENPASTSRTTIIYFGGNAEDVLYTSTMLDDLAARHMLVVNYRGYGRSTGTPGQEALYKDALTIYDYAVSKGTVGDDIVVIGRSLGSAMASMLAGSRPVRGVVLITPFDNLAAVGAGHYPIVPVRWLLRHQFPSADWARKATAPVLILAAEKDFVVPAKHAQALFEVWPGRKEIHVLPGTGHNDIHEHPEYSRLINEFLAAPAKPL